MTKTPAGRRLKISTNVMLRRALARQKGVAQRETTGSQRLDELDGGEALKAIGGGVYESAKVQMPPES
ncbi:MAG: hypothetical protein QOJ51_488 [Acidobacteriaceae bacterium]|nr:hypothetical protein [Acidobacteriaceae bacterium]